jgi:hypothetical protein
VSYNTNGANGSCSGGSDSEAYELTIPTAENKGIIYSAIALRNKSHTPGTGYTERLETHKGSGGDVSGIAIMDKTFMSPPNITVNGEFSSSVDWTIIAVEIR